MSFRLYGPLRLICDFNYSLYHFNHLTSQPKQNIHKYEIKVFFMSVRSVVALEGVECHLKRKKKKNMESNFTYDYIIDR